MGEGENTWVVSGGSLSKENLGEECRFDGDVSRRRWESTGITL